MIAVGMAAVNFSAGLFSFTPLGQRFAQGMAPILDDPNLILPDGTVNLELIPRDLLVEAGLPLTALMLAIFGLVYLYLSYHFRLSMYLVVRDSVGAFQAHFLSLRLMRGHKWSVLKMDLSWWWYYLLVAVITAVGYLDMILGMMGLPLPMGETVMFFATIVAYCVLITALSLWKKCDVDASYVLAYEQILAPMNEEGTL